MTDERNSSLSIIINCTDSEFNIDLIMPSFSLTIPFSLSFLCLILLIVYTLKTPLI